MALDNNASVMKSPLAGPKRGAFEAEIGNPIATPTQDQHKGCEDATCTLGNCVYVTLPSHLFTQKLLMRKM